MKYTIEHYPLTGAYCAKYGEQYLYGDHFTGRVITKDYGYYLYTEQAARDLIKLHKEQNGKENVIIIEVD